MTQMLSGMDQRKKRQHVAVDADDVSDDAEPDSTLAVKAGASKDVPQSLAVPGAAEAVAKAKSKVGASKLAAKSLAVTGAAVAAAKAKGTAKSKAKAKAKVDSFELNSSANELGSVIKAVLKLSFGECLDPFFDVNYWL